MSTQTTTQPTRHSSTPGDHRPRRSRARRIIRRTGFGLLGFFGLMMVIGLINGPQTPTHTAPAPASTVQQLPPATVGTGPITNAVVVHGRFVPEHTIPARCTAAHRTADTVIPEHTVPDQYVPAVVTPAHVVPAHVTASGKQVPEHTVPEHTTPAHTIWAHVVPEQFLPGHDVPAKCTPARVIPAHTT